MKILNLYACLGGNRYKWDEVADIEVTAVEWDEELARLYHFIWTSPPCPTHSRARYWAFGANGKNRYIQI